MIRFAMWVAFWIVTFGVCEIDVRYRDGLHIQLHNAWKVAYRWLKGA
jgi:hypothetical protein